MTQGLYAEQGAEIGNEKSGRTNIENAQVVFDA